MNKCLSKKNFMIYICDKKWSSSVKNSLEEQLPRECSSPAAEQTSRTAINPQSATRRKMNWIFILARLGTGRIHRYQIRGFPCVIVSWWKLFFTLICFIYCWCYCSNGISNSNYLINYCRCFSNIIIIFNLLSSALKHLYWIYVTEKNIIALQILSFIILQLKLFKFLSF